ncbi:MAG: hypothetical protein ABIQ43_04170 [Sphingomonas sp.]
MEGKSATSGIIAAALGVIVLVLGVMTLWSAGTNRGLQQTLAANQEKVAKAQAAANLDNNLVQMLAKSAVDDKDGALRELLRVNGVTLKQEAAAPKPEATPDAK